MADAVGGAAKVNGVVNGEAHDSPAKNELPSHFIGGNLLSKAPPSKVKDFVAAHGGHTVITNVSFQPSRACDSGSPVQLADRRAGSNRKQRHCCGQRDKIG